MALKVKIGGTAYGISPRSLRIKSVLGGRSTAKFSLRGTLAELTRFTKGQEVKIYDDAITESVLVSTAFGPYGVPGLLWTIGHDGKAQVDTIDIPGDDLDDGSLEFIFAINSGLEIVEGLLKQMGVGISFFKVAAFDTGSVYKYSLLDFNLKYSVADAGLYIQVKAYTEFGTATMETTVAALPMADGEPYRLSVTWSYAGGTMTWYFYVNGVEMATTSSSGRLLIPTSMPDYVGWYAIHETQPMVETYIADVRIWSDVRTQAEVDTSKFDYLIGTEGDLIGYWKFDEGTGTTLDDETAASNDGTITTGTTGFPLWGVGAVDWTGTFDGSGMFEYQTLDWCHFCGRIIEPRLEKIGPGAFQQTIEASDHSSRFDDGLVLGDSTNINCASIIQRYVPRIFEDDGIGCRNISPGPLIARVRYYFTTMKKVLDDLAKGSDYIWYVDPYKELRFGPRTTAMAPFDIDDDADPLLYLELRREDVKGRYYNRLYARGKARDTTTGEEITALYMAQDTDEIAVRAAAEGSSGVYEHFEDLPSVRTNEHAVWLMASMLREAMSSGTEITYITRQAGLRVGMLQHITHDDLQVDGDFIIKEIGYSLAGGLDPRYEVLASSNKKSSRLDDMLDDKIESKSNFREPGIETYLPVGTIGNADGVAVSDSLVITSGAI
jgi:hypothetical protein